MLIDKICDEIDILEKDYFSCSYKDSQDVQVCGGRGKEMGGMQDGGGKCDVDSMGEREGDGRDAGWRREM